MGRLTLSAISPLFVDRVGCSLRFCHVELTRISDSFMAHSRVFRGDGGEVFEFWQSWILCMEISNKFSNTGYLLLFQCNTCKILHSFFILITFSNQLWSLLFLFMLAYSNNSYFDLLSCIIHYYNNHHFHGIKWWQQLN